MTLSVICKMFKMGRRNVA